MVLSFFNSRSSRREKRNESIVIIMVKLPQLSTYNARHSYVCVCRTNKQEIYETIICFICYLLFFLPLLISFTQNLIGWTHFSMVEPYSVTKIKNVWCKILYQLNYYYSKYYKWRFKNIHKLNIFRCINNGFS